ncbi:glycosyl hydrolase [Fulvivirga imtechensis AK7]|uniref:Glycosyl hydrolase n=1 Tax=Fulvivirga imtechensis AK7 TaxID=1237149 RepID=L8JUX9_9BACT|nr:sialidase family protein [Fulvivirga imtechensis]ELR71082.1 glycosyl hydrolase [Fulvivirga imtechensis AK7]
MQPINKIITLAVFLVSITGMISGCQISTGSPHARETSSLISVDTADASGAYFTMDHLQQPVLCWTEKISDKEGHVMKFATFEALHQRFGEPVTVTSSTGTRAHDESMNKIAFKEDGTVVAMFAIKHPTEENRFAGSIMYSLSSDEGKTWTSPEYLHDDTAKTYGRSFFDIATLPDGEVGAIWLDGRFGDASTGSVIFFDKTEEGTGFGLDKQVGESTCECCRTDLFVDPAGNVHIAYRDILFPPTLMGQVRDMVHSISYDGGQTFSNAKRISEDNWAIEGCPHTGPSLAVNRHGLHAVWFTAGGDEGVYHVSSTDNGQTFTTREKISKTARHPQMISLPSGALAVVWDEFQGHSEEQHHSGSHGNNAHHAQKNSGSLIMMQVREPGSNIKTINVTRNAAEASHPVVTVLQDHKLLVAWTQKKHQKKGIYYATVDLKVYLP